MKSSKWVMALAGLGLAWSQVPLAAAQPSVWTKPDSMDMNAPANPAAIVTVPEFPQANRRFAIQRTKGPGNVLRVADQKGRLEILNGGAVVTTIDLGRCFSFSRMNDQHDFGRQGSPQYATVPSDCRVWDGRQWSQTYRTQTTHYKNPCFYQPGFKAKVTQGAGGRMIETIGRGAGIVWDTQQTFTVDATVKYDEALGFFRSFDVGYIGQIVVVNEIK